ncbi:Ubiquitin-like protein [Dioscorea alata]|uniref:Ubiquitin-like protein n=1 Tax=Dioscorea alata TaxID=55571 RepID=A0ACB7W4P2_DIOAL|nr:Ubiquitin-like protein [Dioscorea alata]
MAIYQIFVKLLDGRTQCLQIPTPIVSGEALKRSLFSKTKIPLRFQRLVSGSREILDETFISASSDGLFPSCVLLLRLRGGKGGFGSLLRGAATKAGQKKTNNFDACRDMSGRRLRHVNAEKRLEEWRSEAEDRKLEKLAEEFLKKKAKEVKQKNTGDVDKYIEKYREDSARCMEEVDESVRQSFVLYKESKRKVLPLTNPDSKRLKIWLGKKTLDDSDSDMDSDEDDEEKEDEESVVSDDKVSEVEANEGEGSGGSGLFGQSDGESSGGCSGKSNLEEEDVKCLDAAEEDKGCKQSNAGLDDSVEAEKKIVEVVEESVVVSSVETQELKPVAERVDECKSVMKEIVEQSVDVPGLEEPLNLENFNSAAELESLGMERLKTELQAKGLKCGGTLSERAVRLFLLKTTPLDKLPKKLFARPPLTIK